MVYNISSGSKDYHWFITLAADLRVKAESKDEKRLQRDILKIQKLFPSIEENNIRVFPSLEENNSLKENFVFHIMHIRTDNLSFLLKFKNVLLP